VFFHMSAVAQPCVYGEWMFWEITTWAAINERTDDRRVQWGVSTMMNLEVASDWNRQLYQTVVLPPRGPLMIAEHRQG
jgi:hypothetical protein